MISISLCMIVRDEEDVIGRCLDSVKGIFDEIVIVDTGSEDRTKEIVRPYTDTVYDFPWIDDFGAARNFSFSKATMPYCMWLDADDVLLPEDREALLELKESLTDETDVVMLPYHTAFHPDGSPAFSYFRERIIRRCAWLPWLGAIHEAISPSGNITYGTPAVTHKKLHVNDPDRNLRIFEKMISEGKQLVPREQFYYARELYYHARYQDTVDVLEKFLSAGLGWIENNIEACKFLAYCYNQLHDRKKELGALLQSFHFDVPRAEICCELGKYFLEEGSLTMAVYWYEEALDKKRDDTLGGFIQPDCYGYLPCIQLCVCYDRLGNREKAIEYNEKAGEYKPEDKAYLYNKDYFADKKV